MGVALRASVGVCDGTLLKREKGFVLRPKFKLLAFGWEARGRGARRHDWHVKRTELGSRKTELTLVLSLLLKPARCSRLAVAHTAQPVRPRLLSLFGPFPVSVRSARASDELLRLSFVGLEERRNVAGQATAKRAASTSSN